MATNAASPTGASESSLGNILESVAKEKGIEKKILVETIEAAILKAAQSAPRPSPTNQTRVQTGIDRPRKVQSTLAHSPEPSNTLASAPIRPMASIM